MATTDPIPFAIHGNPGVCLDNVSVVLASTCSHSPSWGVDSRISLAEMSPSPVLVVESSQLPAGATLMSPLFAGAFLFACLLSGLVGLLIVVFVVSLACGKRRPTARKAGRKGRQGSLEKGPAPSMAAALIRRPSVSSLPGAAVHQRGLEEILENAEADVIMVTFLLTTLK